MLLIERVVARTDAGDLSGRERDAIIMTAEERRWVRRRVKTANGRDVALALATGTVLDPGALLLIEPGWFLEVEAAEEPILEVLPRDHAAALRVAFEVGNRHFPMAIDGDKILVPDDSAMEHLLARLGEPWSRRRTQFKPIGRGHRHEG